MKTEHNQDFIALQLLDDYYYVGHKKEGFHILRTEAGLVLFDAMEIPDADEQYLMPGLAKLGLAEEPVVEIFLTHGHFDHYLGAEHIRRRTGCRVALSQTDTLFMATSPDNRDKADPMPHITHLVKDGEVVVFGQHTVTVMKAPGHTPGCLNYIFPVHHCGVEHKVLFFGGYGVFGPGQYPGEYYETADHAVTQAGIFAGSCVKSWNYCKAHGVDVYINPHPHLCGLINVLDGSAMSAADALITGAEGVRGWLADRYEDCLRSMQKFTDIQTPSTL